MYLVEGIGFLTVNERYPIIDIPEIPLIVFMPAKEEIQIHLHK